jgi:hypothetical protein
VGNRKESYTEAGERVHVMGGHCPGCGNGFKDTYIHHNLARPDMVDTEKAEIKRIIVQGQPRQKDQETPISTEKKLSVVMCACHPSDSGKLKIGGLFRLAGAKRPYLKNNQCKRAGGVV